MVQLTLSCLILGASSREGKVLEEQTSFPLEPEAELLTSPAHGMGQHVSSLQAHPTSLLCIVGQGGQGGVPGGSVVNNPPASAGDTGSIPGSRFLGERNGKALQYSCLGNPLDREAW